MDTLATAKFYLVSKALSFLRPAIEDELHLPKVCKNSQCAIVK